MAASQPDPIDFDLIESHKENISSLPSGRSAKALAALYSPPLTGSASPLSDAHSAQRATFEAEVASIDEADDPLDVYDRYVKWVLATYPDPSAPQSGLCNLLERATRSFLKSEEYKNDVRYVKMWLQYLALFSDSPREVFVYMSRNGVGEGLALFYEEFAAWLEGQGRWGQAAEVYGLGVERGARPAERLVRRFREFEARRAKAGEAGERPDSPALPVVRAVLGEKVDPFGSREGRDAQVTEVKGEKKKKTKMAIFADGEAKESVLGSGEGNWDFGSAKGRKKENAAEATAWDGQTLKVGKTNAGMGKMQIFKVSKSPNSPAGHLDAERTRTNRQSERQASKEQSRRAMNSSHEAQCTINPRTGKKEMVYVNLDVVYTDIGRTKVEFSFEEVMAKHRGWLERDWKAENRELEEKERRMKMAPPEKKPKKKGFEIFNDGAAADVSPSPDVELVEAPPVEALPVRTVSLNDENNENNENAIPRQAKKTDDIARRMRKEERANRTRKIKMTEVRHEKKETQTVQLNLASPTGPKIRRKKTAEPTMTINTKEAMDEIYGIFSQPAGADKPETEDEDEDSDDDYTSGGESTTTGHLSAPTSEYGDETRNEILQAYGVLPDAEDDAQEGTDTQDDPETTDADEKTEVTGWSDFTTSKHVPQAEESSNAAQKAKLQIFQDDAEPGDPSLHMEDELVTPCEDDTSPPETRFVPLAPEDYEPSNATYRSRAVMANNRLPFMTPIAEQTESSIGTERTDKSRDYFTSKTPSRQTQAVQPILEDDDEVWSSPFNEHIKDVANDKLAILQPGKKSNAVSSPHMEVESKQFHIPESPIIPDKQVNPCDPQIRDIILAQMQPRLAMDSSFNDHRTEEYGRMAEIKKYAKAVSKKASNSDKTASTLSLPPTLSFPGSTHTYTIRRELGCGAFGPVYLVERHSEDETNTERGLLEALKVELSPPSAWEYHLLTLTHTRLSSSPSPTLRRATQSLIPAHELHLYRDASFLIESYSDTGTLLDLVNLSKSIEGCHGGASAGLEESLAMFYTVELLRTVEAMHSADLIHGDLKADNVMLRLPSSSSSPSLSSSTSSRTQEQEVWDASFAPSGEKGWAAHGLTLIDFGRGIDMRNFRPDVRFVADWPTTEADCVEMRELRPWTWQIDYHGLAGTAHTLLWGKYMSVVPDRSAPNTSFSRAEEPLIDLRDAAGGAEMDLGAERAIAEKRRWKTRENLKRYWATEIWAEFFGLMLNSAAEESLKGEEPGKQGRGPLLMGMRRVRERMEGHLAGVSGLQERVRRLEEAAVLARRKKGLA